MAIVINVILCVVLLIIFNVCGKKEKRVPAKSIVPLFFMGLGAAAIILIFTTFVTDWDTMILTGLFGLSDGNILYLLIDNFVLTALVEEGLKYLMVRLYLIKHPVIKCKYQGLVVVSAVAAGFVMAENIVYILADSGLMLRITFGILGHFVYAVYMGYDLSRAVKEEDKSKRNKLYAKALFLPVLLHGVYDFALSILEIDMDAFLFIFIFINMLAVFVAFYIVFTILKIRKAGNEKVDWVTAEVAAPISENPVTINTQQEN